MDDLYKYLLLTFFVVVSVTIYLWMFFEAMFRRNQWFNSDGKTVFITGCDSGIGQRLAEHFYKKNCIVFAGFLDVSGPGAESLRKQLTDRQRFHAIQLDVTKDEQIDKAFRYISQYLEQNDIPGLWTLLNNAGVCIIGEFDWFTMDQCQLEIGVNLMGTIRVTKSFLPLVLKGKGRIVNITTAALSYPGLAVYSASKLGIDAFSDALRLELARFGVKVVVVKPADFAKITNIMSNQKQHAAAMWNNMDDDKRKLYGDYFKNYHEFIDQNSGITSPLSFENSTLVSDFDEAVLAVHPRPAIVCASLKLKLFFLIMSYLPISWKDKLLTYAIDKMFKFNVSKLNTANESD